MKRIYAFIICLLAFTANVAANPIVGTMCGQPDREATLTSADMCAFGLANPDASTVADYYGDTWTAAGELTSNDSNGYLTATSDVGWGVIPNSGTWEIDASFWANFDHAVITMHIGHGGGDPDHFAWLMSDGALSGTWSLDFVADCSVVRCRGGGLSNIKLWGVTGGGTTTISEPGLLAMMFLGLAGMGMLGRRRA